jgi:HEAT repeat protein
MLTFRQFIKEQLLILENRLVKIKEIFKNKIDTSHDSLAQHKDSDAIIDHFATHADPTSKKVHTQWIINLYKKGDFRQSAHPRIREALSNFDRHKSKLAKKDINQYKSLSDVEDAVEPHLGQAASGKEEKRQIKSEGADLIHDDKDLGVTVHHIKTEKAACAYGASTKWCTAGKKNNMFNHYNKEGPIHVIQHQGRKYQFHVASGQFMDEKDISVDFKVVHPDISKSLAKNDHREIQALNLIRGNPHVTSEHITKALDDENSFVRMTAIEHPNATPEHITKALDDKNSFVVRMTAIEHPNATPEHITKALDDEDSSVRRSAIRHPNATSEHITKALDDENSFVRMTAIRHPNATPEHITKALDDKNPDVRMTAIRHPNATPEHITKALDDKNPDVREEARYAKRSRKTQS